MGHIVLIRVAPAVASVSTQPTLTETLHNDSFHLATIDNYSPSQTHSDDGNGMLLTTYDQQLREPVSSDDECDYAPLSDTECSSSDESDDATVWPENDVDEYSSDNSQGSTDNTVLESTVKQSLIKWVVDCNIPRCHVTNLLKRLHNDAKLTFLPLDSRTLMSSKRGKIEVREMPPGKYQHCDIVAALQKILAAMELSGIEIPEVLYMLVNVGGIPLSKSSSSDFWPILIKILGWEDIFVGGIYHGCKKPACINDYLSAFRDDVLRLSTDGLLYKEDMYTYPLPSSAINEYLVSNLSANIEYFPLTSVKCKAFRIPITIPNNGKYFVCPLVNHSLFQL
ncbi:hypothetical protein DAPPUDRAFT_111113 [Daphnia pulex]|uniref:Uncharacterized protein n=1 Tax=Daphnia pulex TaxID=6669 RepID=E9H855_DAPPU|nr:hypothetical protein DAPPUDRAFT_111113 [Daphnia pulex]|eukprot:EFX72012.1 hypothetical protein DAPPUDRAFT_111113 [Daphnia pulex]